MTNLSERDKKMLLHGFSMAGSLAKRHSYLQLLQFFNNLSQVWGIDLTSDANAAELTDIGGQANQEIIDAGLAKGPNLFASGWVKR